MVFRRTSTVPWGLCTDRSYHPHILRNSDPIWFLLLLHLPRILFRTHAFFLQLHAFSRARPTTPPHSHCTILPLGASHSGIALHCALIPCIVLQYLHACTLHVSQAEPTRHRPLCAKCPTSESRYITQRNLTEHDNKISRNEIMPKSV